MNYAHHDRGTDGVILDTTPHLDGGHIIRSAIPSTKFLHTGPYVRLSIDLPLVVLMEHLTISGSSLASYKYISRPELMVF